MSKNTARRLEEMDKSLSGLNGTLSKFESTLKKLDTSLENIATSLGRKEKPSSNFSLNLFSGNKKTVTDTGGNKLMTELKNALDKNHKESFKIYQSMESLLKGINDKLGTGKQKEGGGSPKGEEGTSPKGEGGGTNIDVDIGKSGAPGKAAKGGKGVLSKVGGVLGKAALPLAAVMAGVDAYSGYQKAGENLEIEGREATLGEKLSSSAGSVVSGLTFGLLDEKKASKGIAGFFGAGPGKDKKDEAAAPVSGATPSTAGAISSVATAEIKPSTAEAISSVATAEIKPSTAGDSKSKVEAAASKPAAEPTVKPSASKPSGKPSAGKVSAKEKMQGEDNLQKLEEKEAELQTLQREYKDEKAKASEKLANDTKNYPDGFVDDPSSPEYPKELKAIDDKYKPKIEALKKEVGKLSKAPGVEGAKKAQAAADAEDEDEDEKPTAAPKTKVTGKSSVDKTTTTETVSGGGETTTKRVQTEEAKAAEKELAGLDDKQAAERKQVVDKLKAEGKITGRFAKSSDYETIPELKELKTKQEAERAAISEKISSGTSLETSTVTPVPQSTTTATTVSSLSAENKDLTMEASKPAAPSVVSSNNVQNNNTTSFTPYKTSPRGGLSSLERKQDTVSA